MGKSYSKEYELHYYDVDSNLRCTMSTIINILSDIGTKQSEELGSGMESLLENNMTWVFYNYHVKVFRHPMYGEKLSVKTEAVGSNAIFLLVNLEKRRMMRIPQEQYNVYGVDGDMKEEFKLPRLEKIDEHKYQRNFKIRYTDIDFNKHVNNTKYIDWAVETLPEDIVNNYVLSEVKVTFEKECKYGEEVKVFTDVRVEEGDEIVTIHKIETVDGKELTRLIGRWNKC